MTPEQVNALSDVELNRAMIWLYPPIGNIRQYEWKGDEFTCHTELGLVYVKNFNYLTLWQYTMPLAVESGLSIDLKHGTVLTDKLTHYSDRNPLCAICEVLVLIKCQ